MIKTFSYFIKESAYDSFSEIITSEILRLIKQTNGREVTYDLSYETPISFDLSLTVSKVNKFSSKKDSHFSQLPWEDLNFEKNGFIVDANSYVPTVSDEIPEVEVIIVINKSAEPSCYEALYFKILETVRHELEHTMQKGFNIRPDRASRPSRKSQQSSQDSYKYFLLPDEIPSMVNGMHLSAVKKRIPIDQEFESYLSAFLESGFMTEQEFEKVMKAWLIFAINKFPTVQISNKYGSLVKPNELS
jgi:hypothetical protein